MVDDPQPSPESSTAPVTAPGVPRRRGAALTQQLLEATLALAADSGYRGLSIEAIAQRAGVGKHTIYRRWPSLAELLLDALHHVWVSGLDYRGTVPVRDDLREQFRRSSSALTTPPIGPVYRAVITEALNDPTLRDALHSRFLATVERRTLARLELAQKHGELVEGDLRIPAELLSGSMYYRELLSPDPVDDQLIDGLIDMFMAAYGTRSAEE
ncbi:TetR/AcrR family transcriptional regulator [Brachybacterium sp. DNPG3]